MDLYKTAACNELKRALKRLAELEVSLTATTEDFRKVTTSIRRLVDQLDLIDFQEKAQADGAYRVPSKDLDYTKRGRP